jgi:hypothetical protein
MTEFVDIFSYGLTSSVYIAGSAMMLLVLAMTMLAMGEHDGTVLERALPVAA